MKNKQTPTKIAIVILAAGQSKRMGEAKQNLLWQNKTLLQHCIIQSLNCDAQQVYVVLGAHYELIVNSIEQFPITLLVNNDWSTGMGSSLARGVKCAKTDGFDNVLVMVCDQPSVDSNYLNELIKAYHNVKASKDKATTKIIATQYKNGMNGVPAIFPSEYFTVLTALNADKGARELLNSADSTVASIAPKHALFDIDTIEDYLQHYDASL